MGGDGQKHRPPKGIRGLCPPCYVKNKHMVFKFRTLALKEGVCEWCGYSTCPDALHFHHIDPRTKTYTVSTMQTKKWDLVLEEVEKCQLFCANCHYEEVA